MSEKKNTLGKAVAVAAGVGAAYLALKKKENEKQVLEQQAAQNSNYRNTERGKYEYEIQASDHHVLRSKLQIKQQVRFQRYRHAFHQRLLVYHERVSCTEP